MQWEEVPAGNLPYRVVLDASRPASVFRLSTRTHTEWTFMSDTVDSDYFEHFSVLQLDYELETDLRGDIKAGKTHEIAVRSVPSHDGTPVPGKVTTGDPGRLVRRRRHLAEGRPDPGRRRLVARHVQGARQAGRLRVGPGERRDGRRLQHQAGDHPGLRPAMSREPRRAPGRRLPGARPSLARALPRCAAAGAYSPRHGS